MSVASSRRGFTLIEVVGAGAAFTIAFLAGSAAFARLLQQQTVNYHRTLASAAAMLLTDWHVDAGGGSFLTNTSLGATPLLGAITPGAQVAFKGTEDVSSDVTSGRVYAFNQTASPAVYGSLIVTVSLPSTWETPFAAGDPDQKMTWRQITFWYGSPQMVIGSGPYAVVYVGRYLVPDEVLP